MGRLGSDNRRFVERDEFVDFRRRARQINDNARDAIQALQARLTSLEARVTALENPVTGPPPEG